ncbi:hypothetical protein D9M69_649360 [compost metagenome]
MHRHIGAAALMAHQDVLRGQLVDCLAQGADGYAEALRQEFFGRDRLALLPLALRQRGQHGLLDLRVQGTAERHSR